MQYPLFLYHVNKKLERVRWVARFHLSVLKLPMFLLSVYTLGSESQVYRLRHSVFQLILEQLFFGKFHHTPLLNVLTLVCFLYYCTYSLHSNDSSKKSLLGRRKIPLGNVSC